MVVLAVGSFLLIPLLTRVLTQEEYGIYIISKSNIDIITYLVHFGLISAVSRLYFDYKSKGEQYQYLSTIVLIFAAIAGVFLLLTICFGDFLWERLSPKVPATPYLWYCVLIAIANFFPALASIWLRVEEKAKLFVAMQLTSVLFFLITLVYMLVFAERGITGLLQSLLANSFCGSLVLLFILWKKFHPKLNIAYLKASISYAVPIVAGYVAYFILNRVGLVILQRYVSVGETAVYGLAQQISMIVVIASNSYSVAFQPVIFASSQKQLAGTLSHAGRIFCCLMSGVATVMLLFADNIMSLIAPEHYGSGYYVVLVLIIANILYSANFINNSIFLYYKRPSITVFISTFGGVVATSLSILLVPCYSLYGAAAASFLSFLVILIVSLFLTSRLTKSEHGSYIFSLVGFVFVILIVACVIRFSVHDIFISLALKSILTVIVCGCMVSKYKFATKHTGEIDAAY